MSSQGYGLMFKVRWTLQDTTWESQHDLLTVKELVRKFYGELSGHRAGNLTPEEQMPKVFQSDYVDGNADKEAT